MRKEIERIKYFIKTIVESANAEGVVLGLSGGLDSAVIAVLAKKALGSKNVYCVYLPETIHSNDFDKEHIEKLCKKFDLTYESYEIGSMVELYKKKIPITNKLRLGNVKARIRMNMLYAISARKKCLVIGTGNKSEISIGYFTKWGDGAVDFEPIGHLYKTEVFELAKVLDIPNEIIDKPPSAGLWDGQTDEGELGITYEDLDKALKWIDFISINASAMTQYMFNKDIQKKEPEYVKKVVELIKASKHKRIQPKCLERLK